MKKEIEKIAKVVGVVTLCAVATSNWGFVASTFNLAGSVVRGVGSIALVLLGNPAPGRPAPSFYSGNIGDDGSADEAEPLANYRDNN